MAYGDTQWIVKNDFDAMTSAIAGNGVVSGMLVSESSPAGLSVSVAAGTYYANRVRVKKDTATTVAISTPDNGQPRKDIIVGDEIGTISAVEGLPFPPLPSGQTGVNTKSPLAPAIPSGQTIFGEVWVAAAATQIVNANCADRRVIMRRDTSYITVDAEGNGDFTEISAALASLTGTDYDAMINVRPGSYSPFALTKGKVYIQGSGREVSTIAVTTDAPGIYIDNSGARLSHITIKDLCVVGNIDDYPAYTSQKGIYATNPGSSMLQNIRIRNTYDGVVFDECNGVWLDNIQTAAVERRALWLNGSAGAKALHVRARNLYFDMVNGGSAGESILLTYLEGCEFSHVPVIGGSANDAWTLENCQYNTFYRCGADMQDGYGLKMTNCDNIGWTQAWFSAMGQTGNKNMINLDATTRVRFIGNRIAGAQWRGIYLQNGSNYNTLVGNIVTNASKAGADTYSGIVLDDSEYNSVVGNVSCKGPDNNQKFGIRLTGTSDYNVVTGNMCEANVSGGIYIDLDDPATDSHNKVFDNVGSVTANGAGLCENWGTATVVSGQTSIQVTHNLAGTPTAQNFYVTPTNSLGNATKFWISAVAATTFTITVDADPGATTATFAWYGKVS